MGILDKKEITPVPEIKSAEKGKNPNGSLKWTANIIYKKKIYKKGAGVPANIMSAEIAGLIKRKRVK